MSDNINDDKAIPDKVLNEFVPPMEENDEPKKPLSEFEAEEEVGGDAPAHDPHNMNIEDEEAEKEEDPLLHE